MELLQGQTPDISILLVFLFWDVVYISHHKDDKYSGQIGSQKSSEVRGRFVGFAWDVGHALTFKVLTDDSKKILCRSRLRLAKAIENNLKLDVEAGAVPERTYIKTKRKDDEHLPTIDIRDSPFTVDGEPVPDNIQEVVSEQSKADDSKKSNPSEKTLPDKSATPSVSDNTGKTPPTLSRAERLA